VYVRLLLCWPAIGFLFRLFLTIKYINAYCFYRLARYMRIYLTITVFQQLSFSIKSLQSLREMRSCAGHRVSDSPCSHFRWPNLQAYIFNSVLWNNLLLLNMCSNLKVSIERSSFAQCFAINSVAHAHFTSLGYKLRSGSFRIWYHQ